MTPALLIQYRRSDATHSVNSVMGNVEHRTHMDFDASSAYEPIKACALENYEAEWSTTTTPTL